MRGDTAKTIILFGYGIALALSLVVFITYVVGYNPETGNFEAYVHSVFPYEGHIEIIILSLVILISVYGYVKYIQLFP